MANELHNGSPSSIISAHLRPWKGRPLQPWFPAVTMLTSECSAHLQDGSDLVIVWDACLSQRSTTDAFIVTNDAHVQVWRERQMEVRRSHPLDAKIVEYKSLETGECWRALPDTLSASDKLKGLLLAINMSEDLSLPKSELIELVEHLRKIMVLKHAWKPKEFRKMFRVTSTVAWLVARCSTEGQNVRFLSDEDNMWNNKAQREDVERMLHILTEQACLHSLGRTSWSHYDSGGRYSMPAEDLVAVADRAAGVVAFVAGETRKNGPSEINFPQPKQGRECSKQERLAKWFWARENADLKRVALVIEGGTPESAQARLLTCSFT